MKNKEIKFKGVFFGAIVPEWIVGSLVTDESTSYIVNVVGGEAVWYEVVTETVGQYIGIPDCEDQEIFFGDRISILTGLRCQPQREMIVETWEDVVELKKYRQTKIKVVGNKTDLRAYV